MDLDKLACFLLGVPDTHDHRRILGVPKNRQDIMAIDTALRRRIAQLYSHPKGRTKEATDVKEYLEAIAKDLKASAIKEPIEPHSYPELTPLDQSILAVLISQGGWNRQSRSKLVAVAASYQITVGGLMRILEALGESARSGDGPLSKSRRTKTKLSRDWTTIPTSSQNLVDDFIAKTSKKLIPELNAQSPVMTLKIAVLFGLLTILAFVLSLRVLLAPDIPLPTNESLNTNRISNFSDTEPDLVQKAIKPYESYPKLVFDHTSVNSHDYGDQMLSEVSTLAELRDDIERTLMRGDSFKASWVQSIQAFLDLASNGWFYATPQTQTLLLTELIGVLIESERDPLLSEQIIELLIPTELLLDDAQSINEFVLITELLSGMRCSQRLTPRMRAELTSLQVPTITTCSPDEARGEALEFLSSQLVKLTELEQRTISLWNSWFTLAHTVANDEERFEVFATPIQLVLDSTIDLTRESRTRNLLGSLILQANWSASQHTKMFLQALFKNPDYSNSELWTLSHLVTDVGNMPWLDGCLILELNTSVQRDQLRTDISNVWPEEIEEEITQTYLSLPAGFQDSYVEEWNQVFQNVNKNNDDAATFVTLRKLNESATAIWKGRPGIAQRVLQSIANLQFEEIANNQSLPHQPEGWWRDAFYDARNDMGLRLELIDGLVGIEATDLQPEDAQQLANAALSNSSVKIRRAATKTIIEQFPHGRNIAIALLNQLQNSKSTHEISSIVSNLTEVVLPSISDATWPLQARKAILQHAIALQSASALNLDTIAYELAQSLSAELLLISPKTKPPSGDVSPIEAMKILLQVRYRLLQDMYEVDSLIIFTPSGVLQEFVQLQLKYLELLKLEELQWRSMNTHQFKLPDVSNVMSASNVTRQLILSEYEIALHWDSILNELRQLSAERTMQ